MESDNFDYESLAEKIEKSPTLVANVLKVANSAYYGLAHKVEKVSHAIGIIGVRDFVGIVLGSLLQSFLQDVNLTLEEEARFWVHSYTCSEIMEEADGSYKARIAGLLHDIGKVILKVFYKDDYDFLRSYSSKQEKKLFGVTHSEIGAHFLEHIGLSEEIVRAVREHHTPPSGTGDSLSEKLYFANLLSLFLFGNFVVNVSGIPINLPPDKLSTIKEKAIVFAREITGVSLAKETHTHSLAEFSKLLSVFLKSISRTVPDTLEELIEDLIKVIFDVTLCKAEILIPRNGKMERFFLRNGELFTEVEEVTNLEGNIYPMDIWGENVGYIKILGDTPKEVEAFISAIASIYAPRIYLFKMYSTDFLFHSLYRRIEKLLPFGTIIVSEDGKIVNINDKMLEMFGVDLSPDLVKGKTLEEVFGDELNFLMELFEREENIDIPKKPLAGRFFKIVGRLTREKDRRFLVVIFLDITREIEREARLKKLSITDPLTGIYNQRFFYESLRLEIGKASKENIPLVLLMLDLDNFKEINDKKGHLYGDMILKKVAEVISGSVRRGVDKVFRYGGDEFAIILPGANCKIAENIFKRINGRLQKELGITVSGGGVLYSRGLDIKEFVDEADRALYAAKRCKGGIVLKERR